MRKEAYLLNMTGITAHLHKQSLMISIPMGPEMANHIREFCHGTYKLLINNDIPE